MVFKITFQSIFVLSISLSFLLLFLLSDALAWGPGMHTFIGYISLEGSAFLGEVANLIFNFKREFIWGIVMADIVIGKNLSSWRMHSHNWKVVLRLFEKSEDDRKRAFLLGYMAHLTHDIIAHNFMIPYFEVVSPFVGKNLNHLTVEMRAERLVPTEYFDILLTMLKDESLHECTRYLEENLKGTLLPMPASKKVFLSALHLNILRRKVSEKISRIKRKQGRTDWIDKLILEFADLSAELQRKFLESFPSERFFELDPTGAVPLSFSESLRKSTMKVMKTRPYLKNGLQKDVVKALFQITPKIQDILGKRIPGFET